MFISRLYQQKNCVFSIEVFPPKKVEVLSMGPKRLVLTLAIRN